MIPFVYFQYKHPSYFKITFHLTPYFAGWMGGLKLQGPVYYYLLLGMQCKIWSFWAVYISVHVYFGPITWSSHVSKAYLTPLSVCSTQPGLPYSSSTWGLRYLSQLMLAILATRFTFSALHTAWHHTELPGVGGLGGGGNGHSRRKVEDQSCNKYILHVSVCNIILDSCHILCHNMYQEYVNERKCFAKFYSSLPYYFVQ